MLLHSLVVRMIEHTHTHTKGAQSVVYRDDHDVTLEQVVRLQQSVPTTTSHPGTSVKEHHNGLGVEVLWRLGDLLKRKKDAQISS